MQKYSKNIDWAKYEKEQQQQKKELQEKIKSICENFKQNPESITDYYKFASQFYNYSPKNQCLIYEQNPYATFTGSFNFYKEKGYFVKKGEHGLKIFVPVITTLFCTGENNWKKLSEATKEEKELIKKNQIETKKVQRFKIGNVFDIAQTNVPPEEYPLFFTMGYASEQHSAVFQKVKEYCQNELHCPIEMTDLKSISLRGRYFPNVHKIELNDRLNDSEKLSTTLHEMGHAILHSDEKTTREKPLEQIEFEADSISIMLQSKFGFEINEHRQAHIAEQYRTLSKQNQKFDFEKVLENISSVYTEHIDKLTAYINSDIKIKSKDLTESISPKMQKEDSIEKYCKSVQHTSSVPMEITR